MRWTLTTKSTKMLAPSNRTQDKTDEMTHSWFKPHCIAHHVVIGMSTPPVYMHSSLPLQSTDTKILYRHRHHGRAQPPLPCAPQQSSAADNCCHKARSPPLSRLLPPTTTEHAPKTSRTRRSSLSTGSLRMTTDFPAGASIIAAVRR